jgi:hypothetical protein
VSAPERILLTGSREWAGPAAEARVRKELHLAGFGRDVQWAHGACPRGLDAVADAVLGEDARNVVVRFPVDHAEDGPWPGAGPRRNRRMVEQFAPDRALAFGALARRAQVQSGRRAGDWLWIETGTGGTVRLCLARGVPVRWVEAPDRTAVPLSEMPGAPPPGTVVQ